MTGSSSETEKKRRLLTDTRGLLCYWDFENGSLTAGGSHAYQLRKSDAAIENTHGSVTLREGQYLYIPRAECPALNIHGPAAEVTVLAWVKREDKVLMPIECEAIAGMWLETDRKRQYCLFLNLRIFDSADQVCGHVSSIGGPTPGERWCMDASIGQTPVRKGIWEQVAFTYDGQFVRSYLNGHLDVRPGRNPYHYPQGLYDAGQAGADFTVGAVHRGGEMGNFFAGVLGGLAVFDRALTEAEISSFN